MFSASPEESGAEERRRGGGEGSPRKKPRSIRDERSADSGSLWKS